MQEISSALECGNKGAAIIDEFISKTDGLLSYIDIVRCNGINMQFNTYIQQQYTTKYAISIESILINNDDIKYGTSEFHNAIEGLISDAFDKIGEWIKAAANGLFNIIKGIGRVIYRAFEKVFSIFKKIKDFTTNMIKSAVETITAHPFQSALIALSVIGGIPAIVGLITRSSLPASGAMIANFYKTVTQAIANSPISKWFTVKFSEAGTSIVKRLPIPKKGTPGALGWTADGIRAIFNGLMGLFKKGGIFSRMLNQVISWAKTIWAGIKATDKKILDFLNARKSWFGKCIRFIWNMFREGFTTPFGLLMTCGQQIWKSVSKIKKANKEKEEDDLPEDAPHNPDQVAS